jgi:hypothetical protein
MFLRTAPFFWAAGEDCRGRVAPLWLRFTGGGIPDVLRGLATLVVSRACHFGGGGSSSSRSMIFALRLGTVLTAMLKDGGETLLSRACLLDDGCGPSGSVPWDLRLVVMLCACVGAASDGPVLEREPDLLGAPEAAAVFFLGPLIVSCGLTCWPRLKSSSLASSLSSLSGTPSSGYEFCEALRSQVLAFLWTWSVFWKS